MRRAMACLVALVATAAANAAPIVVDFNSDASGSRPNGFVSNSSPFVSFSDTVGSGLQVSNFGSQSNNSQALAVFDDFDGGILQMNFTQFFNTLSLAFGNDDPGFSNAGDLAVLTLFNGATQVGQVTVVMNRNDIMDQTISYHGNAFTRATFAYTNAAGVPFTGGGATNTGLIEIVDNIAFDTTPEPVSMIVFGGLVVGGGLVARKRLMKKVA